MIAYGSPLLLVTATALVRTLRWHVDQYRWILRTTLQSPPLLRIAIETGWFTTEFGRQPQVVQNISSTWYAHLALSADQLTFPMGSVLTFYALFLIVEVYLMQKYARLGPGTMHNRQPA